MFNLIIIQINAEYSDYFNALVLKGTNGAAPFEMYP